MKVSYIPWITSLGGVLTTAVLGSVCVYNHWVNGQLLDRVDIQREIIETQDGSIDALTNTNEMLNGVIKSKDSINDLQEMINEVTERTLDSCEVRNDQHLESNREGVMIAFPEYATFSDFALSGGEREGLERVFTNERGDFSDNVAEFETSILTSRGKEAYARSTGVFVAPNLFLTTGHSTKFSDDNYIDWFYDLEHSIFIQDGKEIPVRDLVAASPFYDLALFRTEGDFKGFKPVAVGSIEPFEGDEFTYTSFIRDSGLVKNTLGFNEIRDDVYFLSNGKHSFPRISVLGSSEDGESGSPFVHDGKMVGILVSGTEQTTSISYNVHDFLEQI